MASQLPIQITKIFLVFQRALVPPTLKKVPPPMDMCKVVRRQLSVSFDASDVLNSVGLLSDNDTANDYSLSEPEIDGALSGSSNQVIEAGCYCILKVYSSDGMFTMLVELVLRGPGDHGCPQKSFQAGGKFDILLRPILLSLLTMQRKWTYTSGSQTF